MFIHNYLMVKEAIMYNYKRRIELFLAGVVLAWWLIPLILFSETLLSVWLFGGKTASYLLWQKIKAYPMRLLRAWR